MWKTDLVKGGLLKTMLRKGNNVGSQHVLLSKKKRKRFLKYFKEIPSFKSNLYISLYQIRKKKISKFKPVADDKLAIIKLTKYKFKGLET